MPTVALLSLVEKLTLAGMALTAVKLFATGLHRRYKVFACFSIVSLFSATWPLFLDVSSQAYLKTWVCTEPVLWVFYVLVVRELYQLILEKHRGLFTLGRWIMYGAIVVSVAVSIMSLLPKIRAAAPQRSLIMPYWIGIERGLDLAIVVFLLLILFVLSLYPVPLSRNLAAHTVIYSVYFFAGALSVLLRVIFGLRLAAEVNGVRIAVSAACWLAWFVAFSRRGEEARFNLPWISPTHEKQLLRHLDAINSTLLSAPGK